VVHPIHTMSDSEDPPSIVHSKASPKIDIENVDGIAYLASVEGGTVDLVLTDPPYIISRASGMNAHYETVAANAAAGVEFAKTEAEWDEHKAKAGLAAATETQKDNYLRHGSIYGTKYCVKTDYGEWDSAFTMEALAVFVREYYRALRKGGTIIIFFDLFKISYLKEIMEGCGFKQIRFIEWIKTNPQPLNSKVNYLTNCREIALLGVKGGKPTFNSKYDKGVYEFPLQGGKTRFHPTQKSLPLMQALIEKHSNAGDTVLDTFAGSGTTAVACLRTGRAFKGAEVSPEYFGKMRDVFPELFVERE
jgi:DNA modification methylase